MTDYAQPDDAQPSDNPFATRYVRPGAQAFLFPGDESLEQLVSRLRQNHWQGQIVGPHGAGKSTLLASLIPVLRAADRHVIHVVLRAAQRRLPRELWAEIRHPNTLLIVDGYEQLSRLSRWRIRTRCHRARCGLLVTAHQSVGLADLYQVVPSLETTHRLIRQITAGRNTTLTEADVEASYATRGPDIREMLFDLYDLHHRRSHPSRHGS